MDIAKNRRGWRVRSGRHLYDADRETSDDDEGDGWVATFTSERDAAFVAELVADTATERERAARAAAHGALWDAQRAMHMAGIDTNTVAGQILTDAIAAHEPQGE